jgi:hypothetical protein
MLGFYSDEISSQHYPPPLNLFYPDHASFVAFISNIRSGLTLFQALRIFRNYSDFPVQGLLMSEKLVPDIRRSDHASFWDLGYSAIMVTDTAFYRNMNYHTVGDVTETLNFKKMAKLTHGLALMLAKQACVIHR